MPRHAPPRCRSAPFRIIHTSKSPDPVGKTGPGFAVYRLQLSSPVRRPDRTASHPAPARTVSRLRASAVRQYQGSRKETVKLPLYPGARVTVTVLFSPQLSASASPVAASRAV